MAAVPEAAQAPRGLGTAPAAGGGRLRLSRRAAVTGPTAGNGG